jgi:protoporphyrinogen oxidase
MISPRVAILGAGPAGVGAAWLLHRANKGRAVVIEQRDDVGGNAGSFEIDGVPVDYGSHRLHPACDAQILADIRGLLGSDLLSRPRHGRIRLRGKWIRFPIRPVDLISLPLSFGLGIALDSLRKVIPRPTNGSGASFASELERGLGRTICRDFYFPYAVKIWGMPPQDLSAIQARRRVSAGSLGKMMRKVLTLVPGFKAPQAGRFYYPRQGYGQISRALADASRSLGADIRLGTKVRSVHLGAPHRIETESAAGVEVLEAEHVWSTIPISILARVIDPPAPAPVLDACRRIEYRAMILIYVVLAQSQFSAFDAHYFPESEVRLTRLSEPKNYSARSEPSDRTVLCGELPCTVDDDVWRASDAELGELVRDSLARCGLPIRVPILGVLTKRLPFAYPIYRTGYEEHFRRLDEWVAGLEGILTFGRQGLFAHDNTHHTLAMAYAAVECLSAATGRFDWNRWRDHRTQFESHVVED